MSWYELPHDPLVPALEGLFDCMDEPSFKKSPGDETLKTSFCQAPRPPISSETAAANKIAQITLVSSPFPPWTETILCQIKVVTQLPPTVIIVCQIKEERNLSGGAIPAIFTGLILRSSASSP
jgi:hypothetical protein